MKVFYDCKMLLEIVVLLILITNSRCQVNIPSVAGTTNTFTLKYSPEIVELAVTENVTLECTSNSSVPTNISHVSIIRVLRRDESYRWIPLAEMRDIENTVDIYGNVNATGQISDGNSETFIRITWAKANFQTFGEYRCDVIGFDNNQNIIVEKTLSAVIVVHNITAREVLALLLTEREYFKQEIERQNQEQNHKLDLAVAEMNRTEMEHLEKITEIGKILTNIQAVVLIQSEKIAELDLKLAQVSDCCNTTKASLSQTLNILSKTLPWPGGVYGLPKADTGCPLGAEWQEGSVIIHTESGVDNVDNTSTIIHLEKPVLIQNGNDRLINQTFCVVSVNSNSHTWPPGSYCINRKGGSCPNRFKSGYIRFDEEDGNYNSSSGGIIPDLTTDGYSLTEIYYCCRDDGAPEIPTVFPTSSPFYLYKYKGRCQEVYGMIVTEEFVIFDTENDGNDDSYENGYHPEGNLSNVKIELCFYS